MAAKIPIALTLNGTERHAEVDPRTLLVHFLRESMNLTGTHIGCETTICGACTVLMKEPGDIAPKAVKSCTIFAAQADGAEVTTIEGLAGDGDLHPVQQGFWECHGLQCGYCTPGMILASVELLQNNPRPSREQIAHALEGNLCRCTGYTHIIDAVEHAAKASSRK